MISRESSLEEKSEPFRRATGPNSGPRFSTRPGAHYLIVEEPEPLYSKKTVGSVEASDRPMNAVEQFLHAGRVVRFNLTIKGQKTPQMISTTRNCCELPFLGMSRDIKFAVMQVESQRRFEVPRQARPVPIDQ
jgi:hypothetical protein